MFKTITDGGETLAIVIRGAYRPQETTFVTPPNFTEQVGLVVYPADSEIPRHRHAPTGRFINGTAECLIVREGKTEITLFNHRQEQVSRLELHKGDVVVLSEGVGHGLRQFEDTVLLEIKQGPYAGPESKEFF